MAIGIVTETQKQLLRRDVSMFKDIKNGRTKESIRKRERYMNYFDNWR